MAISFSEQQIESLSPNAAAFSSGKSLANKSKWIAMAQSERAVWGEIKGSGSAPYQTQIDITSLAFKCPCPSRQFPCKHGIALSLLYARSATDFSLQTTEPDWVKNWLEKRDAKVSKPAVDAPQVINQVESDKSKLKTQSERIESVKQGVAELELWLADIVRIGIIELPNKSTAEFEKIAARMIDAKASGLAFLVKEFTKLDFSSSNQWQSEALELIARIYLLLQAFNNIDSLSDTWQLTVKNLIGWNQSPKELLVDSEAEIIADNWLVVGQEIEKNDDVSALCSWLVGCKTNRKAVILNFGTKYNPIENQPIVGNCIVGELAFFPSVLPFRAVIKQQQCVENELTHLPILFKTFDAAFVYRSAQLCLLPWQIDF